MRGSRTIAANTIQALSKLVCRSYCHKIIKLSKTLPVFASYKECECNVHGVRSDFLKANEDSSIATKEGTTQIYFIGKILWAKGFQYMLDGQEKYNERFGGYFPIDVYGGGPEFEQVKRAFFGVRGNQGATPKEETKEPPESSDKITDDENGESHNRYSQLSQMMLKSMPFLKDEIEETDENSSNENSSTLKTIKDSFQLVRNFQKESLLEKVPRNKYEWRKKPLPAQFCGPKDHAALKFSSYKVFVNPSVTEVLCTTTAEALAMGKFVVLPKHPSNEFFYQFPNCLSYGNMDEFVELVHFALNNVPTPLSAEMAHRFTWEAAMKRLIDAAAVTQSEYTELEKSGRFQRDRRKAWIHKESGRMLRGDTLKSMVGEFPLQDLKLKDYELDADLKREDDGHLLYFDNNSPKVLALLSFIIAILSYFAQR
jgi:glycosyltransferase involved in cell wall biosynthesis